MADTPEFLPTGTTSGMLGWSLSDIIFLSEGFGNFTPKSILLAPNGTYVTLIDELTSSGRSLSYTISSYGVALYWLSKPLKNDIFLDALLVFKGLRIFGLKET
jgi:hypothetical protein